MQVGFIGLGRMGAPMAARIAAAGHSVIGYDVAAARRQHGVPGVVFADGPAAAAADADIVITSLPGPDEAQNVIDGPNGLLASLKPAAILVETSTISPQQSRAFAAAFVARNLSYLDAPISGGVQGARDGTLVAMVGGSAEALERARPVLSCFAAKIFHLGPAGAGNVMKLVIQSIFLSQMAGFLESVSMGERSGIALDTLLSVVASSSAHHPTIGTRYEKLRAENLDPMFEVESAVKDLSLAEDVWRELGGLFPTLASALSDYRGAVAGGLSGADLIAVRTWLNRAGT
jgi:3-hydroxyisobutyrate dehydrogenase-like beta-hydroxyacid dehydrogenase